LGKLFFQLNSGRRERLGEELVVLGSLPERRLESSKRLRVRVGPSSTIRVSRNTYSVQSRLIGELVDVRLCAEHLEVSYAQRQVEKISRLRGEGKHRVSYRHIIDWLVRKPGAFENYRYRDDLFPTSRFRMAYDSLRGRLSSRGASREYLGILYLAARGSEGAVDDALRLLIDRGEQITVEAVKARLDSSESVAPATDVTVRVVRLDDYDELLCAREVSS
jgi:hypothetical protein